jgi:hypothetical protein
MPPSIFSECEPKRPPKGYKIPIGKIEFKGELPGTDGALAIAVVAIGIRFGLIVQLIDAVASLLDVLDELVFGAVLSVVANGDRNGHGFSVGLGGFEGMV